MYNLGFWVVYYFDFHLVLSLVIFIREISRIHNTYLYGVDFSFLGFWVVYYFDFHLVLIFWAFGLFIILIFILAFGDFLFI